MIVDGTTITMVNGDSETITVNQLDDAGDQVDFITGDVVTFTMKKSALTETPDLIKTVTNFTAGKAIIVLDPVDTVNLSGGYDYDVQLTKSGGQVTTIVRPSQFIVETGVTE